MYIHINRNITQNNMIYNCNNKCLINEFNLPFTRDISITKPQATDRGCWSTLQVTQ